jgi:predicted secreted Zn-dependent protease
VLDILLSVTAVMASQGGYGMPLAPPPMPPVEQRAPTKQAPAPPPQPVVAAVPGKTLRDLPNVTIRYFDVAGKNLKAINKSMERAQKPDSSGRAAAAPTSWAIDVAFNKTTGNGQCKVVGAKATFSATVVLPRLVPDTAHSSELTAAWRAHLAGVENNHAANLWFVYDRIREVENAVLASSCENAQSAGAAAIERIRAQAAEFQRSNAAARAGS